MSTFHTRRDVYITTRNALRNAFTCEVLDFARDMPIVANDSDRWVAWLRHTLDAARDAADVAARKAARAV